MNASYVVFEIPRRRIASRYLADQGASNRTYLDSQGVPTPYPAIPKKSRLGELGLSRAEPVNVEMENGGETRTSV